jgi:predicted anti-sigma-YlaC factor YlaD
MKHKDIEKLIQKSLDRETTQEEEHILRSHLSRCHDCQEQYEAFYLTSQMVGELIELFPQPGFNTRLLRKLAVKKARVWTKAALIFSAAWIGSLVFMILSPLPHQCMNWMLTSAPGVLRLVDEIQLIVSSVSHTLLPILKISLNLSFPIVSVILSILLFYFFGKILSPVKKLGKENNTMSKGRVF